MSEGCIERVPVEGCAVSVSFSLRFPPRPPSLPPSLPLFLSIISSSAGSSTLGPWPPSPSWVSQTSPPSSGWCVPSLPPRFPPVPLPFPLALTASPSLLRPPLPDLPLLHGWTSHGPSPARPHHSAVTPREGGAEGSADCNGQPGVDLGQHDR